MAELRTEIAELTTRIDTGILALKREAMAMRAIHDALKKRADAEIAGDYELEKLEALEPKVAAIEDALEQADTGPGSGTGEKSSKKAAADKTGAATTTQSQTHAKTHEK